MQKSHIARRYLYKAHCNEFFCEDFLDYYMTRSEIVIPNSNIKATVYGVEIEKKQRKNAKEITVEKACIKDVFTTGTHTKDFIAKLAQLRITPSSLKSEISTLLGESGFEPPEITIS